MSARKPQHRDNPEGVEAVWTRSARKADRSMDEAVMPGRINCYTGAAGCGKTFTVTQALLQREEKVRSIFLGCPDIPTMRSLLRELAERIGVKFSLSTPAHDLTFLLRDHLRPTEEDPRLVCIVVDECQKMRSTACPEVMRSLVEHDSTSFSLMFVGGDGARAVLEGEPMLWSRMYRPVGFYPLDTDEVVEMLPVYCPSLYEGVKPELLEWIDIEHCQGRFRDWSSFTHRAQKVLKESRRRKLTEQVARAAFEGP